jgi:hypothetical protein
MTGTHPTPRATGGCLCGAVRYELNGPLRDVVNCHCAQCRRTHGHFAAYTNTKRADLVLRESRGLRWYASSNRARRGFCAECGASLFWEPAGTEDTSVAAGTLDAPTGLETVANIYVAAKGDYYDIADGLPQSPSGLGSG